MSDSKISAVNESTLKEFLDAFNRHDLDAIMNFFSDDFCQFDSPRGPNPFGKRYLGKSEVREGLAGRFKGIPNVHYGEDRHFISKDGKRAASQWLLTGTSVSGQRFEVRGCDLFDFDESGKMTIKDSYWKIVEV